MTTAIPATMPTAPRIAAPIMVRRNIRTVQMESKILQRLEGRESHGSQDKKYKTKAYAEGKDEEETILRMKTRAF